MTYIDSYHTWATGEELTPERLNGNANAIVDGLTDGTKDLNLNQATGELVGNATTTTKLATGRVLQVGAPYTSESYSSTFDGSADVTLTVNNTSAGTISNSITVCSGFRDSMRALFDDANSNAAILADATAQSMMLQALKSYNSGIATTYTDEIVPLNTYLTTNHSYTWSSPQLAVFNDANIAAGIPGNVEKSHNMYLYEVVKNGAIGVGYEPYYNLTFGDETTQVLPATMMGKQISVSFTCFPYDMVLPSDPDFVNCLLMRNRDTKPAYNAVERNYTRSCVVPNIALMGFFNSSNLYTTMLQVWFTQKYFDLTITPGVRTTTNIVKSRALRPESFSVRVIG